MLRRAGQRGWVLGVAALPLAAGLLAGPGGAAGAVAASGPPAGATMISAGTFYACGIAGGQASCWGFGSAGNLGDGSFGNSQVPVPVDTSGALAGQTLTQISAAAGGFTTCALDTAGDAYCWGLHDLGDGGTGNSAVPVAVQMPAARTFTDISAGGAGACAVDIYAHVYCWGNGTLVPALIETGALREKSLTQVSVGQGSACAIDRSGHAYCWGANESGQLGDGSTASSTVPVAVDPSGALAGQTLRQISVGENEACAVDTAGQSYCWGGGMYGDLGDGSAAGSDVPAPVDTSGALAGQDVTSISTDGQFTCALSSAGRAYCWGLNFGGQLGNGTVLDSAVPVAVRTDGPLAGTALTQLSAGWTVTCAEGSPGGFYCWGANFAGQLGDDTSAGQSDVPVAVGSRPPPALQGPVASGYREGHCVAGAGDKTAAGTAVALRPCDESAAQDWTFDQQDGEMQAGGTCLTVAGGSTASKARVELDSCAGSAAQQWEAAGGTLLNPVSGRCLDDPRLGVADETRLEIYACDGGANQQWRLLVPLTTR
jgi:alpha-tubulin suppressor-like RCC1 family protein